MLHGGSPARVPLVAYDTMLHLGMKKTSTKKSQDTTQEHIFLNGEGDRWLDRNSRTLSADARPDPALTLITQYGIKPKKVLEIGCSNGWRIAELARVYKSSCIGIDPSAKAVREGTVQYPAIKLMRGTTANIPLKEKFDLVIINYVMHWVSREELLRSLSEIDRVLEDGGLLLIGDCETLYPTRTKYHHLPEENVWTFKANYAGMFVSTGLYRQLARVSFRERDHVITIEGALNDRGAVALLKKSLSEYYTEGMRA